VSSLDDLIVYAVSYQFKDLLLIKLRATIMCVRAFSHVNFHIQR
jgi:hypothetical protein